MEIAIGNAEMYIMMRYETCMAGCSRAKFTAAKPAVRVEEAWKRPSTNLMPGGNVVMTGSFRSRIMKKIKSRPFNMTRMVKSHHVAAVGNKSVKHRLG